MKVEGPNKSSGVKGASKSGAKQGAGGAAFSGMLGGADDVSEAKNVSGPMAVGGIDALLSLQDVGNSTEESTKRAKKRALSLLDKLDELKVEILTGRVPQHTLHQLSNMIATQRESVMDPKLAAVLDEVDLRVQVELAKFSRR